MDIISSPPAYKTSALQKARSRDAAHRFRFGSPKLVDMMREKCRIRIKQARSTHLLNKRSIVPEEKAFLESIVREELSELEHDIELQELIFKELIAGTDDWLFDAYEQSENYLIDQYDVDVVFCPLCQKHPLEQGGNPADTLFCCCGVRFNYRETKETFGQLLTASMSEHARRCAAEIQFFVEPIADSSCVQLNAFCPACDFCKGLTK